MSVRHFENGRDVTMQHVNTAAKVENMQVDQLAAATWDKTFSVPANKQWTVHRITGYRDASGDIVIYLRDPSANYVMLDSDLAVDSGLKLIIDQPFTITYGWEITVQFYTAAVNMMYAHILYSEEPE